MAKRKKTAKRKKRGMGAIKVSRFNVKRYSLKELKQARSQGFRTKRPKKPKSQTVEALESYLKKHNAWVDAVKHNAATRQTVLALQGVVKKCR